MRTITTEIYKFEELSKDAKQKAVESNRDFNISENWWDECVIEDRQAKLREYGFDNPKILYSGFASQGDGACFIGELDNEGFKMFVTKQRNEGEYPNLLLAVEAGDIYINLEISHNERYYHAYSTNVNDYTEMQNNNELPKKLQDEWDKFMEMFHYTTSDNNNIGWYIDECNDIYKHLGKEYQYQTDDDTIAESLIANEMEFTIDGKGA